MARAHPPLEANSARSSWNGRALTARGRLDPESAWSLLGDMAETMRIALDLDHVEVRIGATRTGTASAYARHDAGGHGLDEAAAKALGIIATHCLPWEGHRGAQDDHWTLRRARPASAALRAIEWRDRALAMDPHLGRVCAYLRSRSRGNLARRIETMAKEACKA